MTDVLRLPGDRSVDLTLPDKLSPVKTFPVVLYTLNRSPATVIWCMSPAFVPQT